MGKWMGAFACAFAVNVVSPVAACAQANGAPPTTRAFPTTQQISIDGRLDETAWQHADSILSLTQVEPQQGGSATGRTIVRVLVTPDALIFGVRADDPEPTRLVSFTKARDGALTSEDHVALVLDTFLDGRSGYVFRINPSGARYDALVANRGEGESSNWDAIWEAQTALGAEGWSAEIRIPIRSLIFRKGLDAWGFNIERRIQRLQETSRWAGAVRDYKISHTGHAGLLEGLPHFGLGLGLSVRPSVTAGTSRSAAATTRTASDVSLDATQRIGSNLLGSVTFNTDFAETEVDTRRTNLTRFPLLFPEKRTFFLEGLDIFDFGLGLGEDVLPFHSRRIGLIAGQEVPIIAGAKVNGHIGRTSIGALLTGADELDDLTSRTAMGVVRVKQDVLRESSVGMIATFGDPLSVSRSWLAGADFTYQTSHFPGGKNFLVGVWGLALDRAGLTGDRTAAGIKIDYPNDVWDLTLTYRRVGDAFQPSLGFVQRPGVHAASAGINHRRRPGKGPIRYYFYEFQPSAVFDLAGEWESYRLFMAPVNWRFESGDRFELNWVPQGERLTAPFEIADSVVIPAGAYHFNRYRVEGQFAAKRKLSGMATWWFGEFYGGRLHELEFRGTWNPTPLVTLEVTGERNIGRLPQGDFTVDLLGTRFKLNVSPDFQLSTLVQYDTESRSLGSNTRARWTFHPLGDLFLVYNHNIRDRLDRWSFESNQLLLKAQYTFRY